MPNPKRQLPRRVYPLRALGMGLAGLVVGVVLWERNAGLAAWLCMAAISFVWPHVAHLLSRRSADPYRAEIRNLLVDSALSVVLGSLWLWLTRCGRRLNSRRWPAEVDALVEASIIRDVPDAPQELLALTRSRILRRIEET